MDDLPLPPPPPGLTIPPPQPSELDTQFSDTPPLPSPPPPPGIDVVNDSTTAATEQESNLDEDFNRLGLNVNKKTQPYLLIKEIKCMGISIE